MTYLANGFKPRLPMDETRLFNIETKCHLESILRQDEVVTAVNGSSTDFFFGTNVGRLYHLKIETAGAVLIKEIVLVQKPHPIVNILPASAFDLLIVQCGHALVYIDLESFAIRNKSSANHASCVALNVDPDLDDPFVLSMAIGTVNKQIHVVERKNEANNVVVKVHIPASAEIICYSKQTLCFATKTDYFVHDLQTSITHSLFPYDSTIVRPLAVCVDQDEFVLSGIQGLAMFATSAGNSSRAPLNCGIKKIVSFVFHYPFIHILSDDSLMVFSVHDQKMKQEIECDKSEFMCNIDGRIFLSGRRGNFYELTPIQWMDQAQDLLAKNEVDACLKFAEHHLQISDFDTNQLTKFNFLKQKCAFLKLFAGEWEVAKKLLIESEVNPADVTNLFKELRFGDFQKSSFHEKDEDLKLNVEELTEYFLAVRALDWASYATQTIDKALVKLFALSKNYEAIRELDSKQWNDEETRSWMLNHEEFALAADLMFLAGDNTRAFELWKRLGSGELRDKRFDAGTVLEALKTMSSRSIVEESVKWLTKLDPSGVARTVDKLKIKLSFEFVCEVLKSSRPNLIEFVGRRIVDTEDPKVHQMYLDILIDEVKISESQKARRKLRRAIFDIEGIDWSAVQATLFKDDRFPVELILVQAKTGSPEKALDDLLKMQKEDQEAAELLCSRMNNKCPQLFKKLLSYYLKKDPSNEQVRLRILSLLKGMGGASEASEVLKSVPSDWKLSDLSLFLQRSTARVEEEVLFAEMRRDLSQAALENLKACDKLRGCSDFIVVNESTKCSFCGGPVGNEVIVRHPQTNAIYHQSCDNT
ncbi:hypothetical protein L596_020245 [Steinernema carpocapsae]|uniref:CNH domain-containing protein n=2 Tax=Steinernema carpocapsae TaxID=34508 RepID=A0A4U5MTR6_STECR|nr:hypothetical protein L596_020245 [Steinernema carpocapsae]